MDKSATVIPALNEELWNVWVQKGGRADAARSRRWRFFAGAVVLAGGLAATFYPALFGS